MSNPEKSAVVYSIPNCGFCMKVKHLLRTQDIKFSERVIGKDVTKEEAITEIGRNITSVPQVVIDGEYVGSYSSTMKYLKIKD